MTLAEEFRSRNFSKLAPIRREPLTAYASEHLLTYSSQVYTDNGMRRQSDRRRILCANANTPITRTGVLCIILCFALGIANIFHFDIIILWSVICLYVFVPPPGSQASPC